MSAHSYHHGNLRAALLEAGLELIREVGPRVSLSGKSLAEPAFHTMLRTVIFRIRMN
jgi:hypothetical protein